MAKKFKVKKSKINYDLPYEGPEFTSNRDDLTSLKENFAERGGSLRDGEYIIERLDDGSKRIRQRLSSPAEYKKGGKFNPKYTKGSKNVGERKKLMAEIASIYDKHRGTKDKRKKKGFPPAVAKRLKELMKRRDKL